NHRQAVEQFEILARDTLAAAPGRNTGYRAHARFSSRNRVTSSAGNCESRPRNSSCSVNSRISDFYHQFSGGRALRLAGGEQTLQLFDHVVLLGFAHGREDRQADGLRVIALSFREIARLEPQVPVIRLQVDGNIVQIDADPGSTQGFENLAMAQGQDRKST